MIHVLLASTIFSLVLLYWGFDSAYNAEYHFPKYTKLTWKYSINCLITSPSKFRSINLRYRSRCKYFKSRVPYSPNSTPSFNILDVDSTAFLVPSSLLLSGDINPNPGPGRRRGESGNKGFARNTTSPLHEHDIFKIPHYGIKLVSWNIQHLSNKVEEIKLILRTEEIDVLCLQETFLTSETNDNQLAVENYGIFRRDRPTGQGGGIIVYVHNRIEARRWFDLEDANLGLIWLELRQREYRGKFLCGFIYRPPNVNAQIDSNIVSNLEGAILNSNETWLLGDVNINLTETNPLPSLPQTLSNIGLHQLISGVTRPASQTCLDHIYSTEISRIVASGILVYGPSNHLPVFAVRQQFIKPKRSHTIIQYRDYKHLNENSLREDLQQLPFNDIILESNGSVNASLEKWYSLFNSVVNKHLPLSQKRVKRPTNLLGFQNSYSTLLNIETNY